MGHRKGGGDWEQSEDDIADNWEEELEEPAPVIPAPPKPKSRVKSTPEPEPMTTTTTMVAESAAERKQRLETAVKRSDLQNTMDLFGVSGTEVDVEGVLRQEADLLSLGPRPQVARTLPSSSPHLHFESADPQSIPEFEKFAEYVAGHLNQRLAERKNYHAFLESLMRRLLQSRDVGEVRKLAGILQEMAAAKQKEQRQPGPASAPTATTTTIPTGQAKAAPKKKPILLATKKGRDLDLTDYGSVSYDDDDE